MVGHSVRRLRSFARISPITFLIAEKKRTNRKQNKQKKTKQNTPSVSINKVTCYSQRMCPSIKKTREPVVV